MSSWWKCEAHTQIFGSQKHPLPIYGLVVRLHVGRSAALVPRHHFDSCIVLHGCQRCFCGTASTVQRWSGWCSLAKLSGSQSLGGTGRQASAAKMQPRRNLKGQLKGRCGKGRSTGRPHCPSPSQKGVCGWVIASRFVSQARAKDGKRLAKKLVPSPPSGHSLAQGSAEWPIFADGDQRDTGTAQNDQCRW